LQKRRCTVKSWPSQFWQIKPRGLILNYVCRLEGTNRRTKLSSPVPSAPAISPQPEGIQPGLPSKDFTFTFGHNESQKEDAPLPPFASEAAELFILAQLGCDRYTWTSANRVQNQRKVISAVQTQMPHIHPSFIKSASLEYVDGLTLSSTVQADTSTEQKRIVGNALRR
jgi:hypothetical protein